MGIDALDPPFPAAQSRYTYHLNSRQNFEYCHGTGTMPKRNLDERPGVARDEEGGPQDEDGCTLRW